MNIANRLGASLILLAVTVVALMFALSPQPLVEPLRLALAAAERRLDAFSQLIVAVVALIIAVIALLVIVAEWRRPARRSVVVSKVPGGTAELDVESVAMRIRRAAESVSGIREASTIIRGKRNGIDVVLRISSDPEVDLPQKSKEVMEAVRTEAETKMGIPVKSLRVTFKHSPGQGRLPAALPDPSTRDSTGI